MQDLKPPWYIMSWFCTCDTNSIKTPSRGTVLNNPPTRLRFTLVSLPFCLELLRHIHWLNAHKSRNGQPECSFCCLNPRGQPSGCRLYNVWTITLRDRSLNMGRGGRGFRQIFREKTSGPPFKLCEKFSAPPFRPREKIGSPPFFSNISLHAIWL